MRQLIRAPRRSLQVRILASVLLGLGVVLLGLAVLISEITEENTRHALAERLALARAIQQAADREILAAVAFGERLGRLVLGRTAGELAPLLELASPLEAVAIVGPDGKAVLAASRHGVLPAWHALPPEQGGGARVFAIPGDQPAIGIAVPIGQDRLLLGQVDRSRLLDVLAAPPAGERYTAQLIGADGSQIAVARLPAESIRQHLVLVQGMHLKGEAGVVLHAGPNHHSDHYVAFAPLATLPGWGVTVEQPRDVVVALPRRLRALILTGGLLTLLLGGAVAWFDVRRVVTPLRTLAQAAGRIGTGDLATPVEARGQDEIAVLAQSLDQMRRRLGDSLAEIKRREARARALHEVGTGILRIQGREEALNLIVREARRLLAGDVAMLCLHDAQAQQVLSVAMAGQTEAVIARGAVACQPPDIGGCPVLAEEYRAGHLVAPVRVGDTSLGWLCVGTRAPRAFTEEDAILLESFGTLAALALENLRLRDEVQSLGAIQERERLARELHDGVAQALGVVYAHASSGVDQAAMRRSLERIAEVSSRAYEEVRQAIFGLRLPHDTDLPTAIGEYLREFTRQTGLPVNLVVEDRRAAVLPRDAEVQVVRIVQEALANVRRHARAGRAVVRFAREADDVVVSIEDDGQGFQLEEIEGRQGHYGLLTMKERAASIGGTLTITSMSGRGTRVVVRLPAGGREGSAWMRSG